MKCLSLTVIIYVVNYQKVVSIGIVRGRQRGEALGCSMGKFFDVGKGLRKNYRVFTAYNYINLHEKK